MSQINKQLSLFPGYDGELVNAYVPFVSEVEQFNETFGKPNNIQQTGRSTKQERLRCLYNLWIKTSEATTK